MLPAAALTLAAFAVSKAPSEECGKLVECGNASLGLNAKGTSFKAPQMKGCPGSPPCSGRGQCHETKSSTSSVYSCKCEGGYFGKDCSHKKHDCAKLTSCADCQDPANTKFCGWCADGRYCVPKHVHSALLQKPQDASKKACAVWYEDSCPAPKPKPRPIDDANATEDADLSFELDAADEWGDERSVALAEALVAMIDEKGGKGTSGVLGFLLLMLCGACGARLAYNEKRAIERQRRFTEFMQTGEASKSASPAQQRLASFGGRQLGLAYGLDPPPPPSRDAAAAERFGAAPGGGGAEKGVRAPPLNGTQGLDHASLSHALGLSSARDDAGASTGAAAATPPPEVAAAETAAAREAREAAAREEGERQVREAAERDLAERKARQRARAEDARVEAVAAERRAAEEAARRGLQSRTKEALAASSAAAGAGAAEAGARAAEATTEPLPAAFGKEEAEFLKALDDL